MLLVRFRPAVYVGLPRRMQSGVDRPLDFSDWDPDEAAELDDVYSPLENPAADARLRDAQSLGEFRDIN